MTEQPEQPTDQDENEAGMPYAAASDYCQAPAQTEQQFLGNEQRGDVPFSSDPKFGPVFKAEQWPEGLIGKRQARERLGDWFNLPGDAPLSPEDPEAFRMPEPRTDLLVEAETAAHHASKSFENGEIAAGIAWSESAMAFGKQALLYKPRFAKMIDRTANAPVASSAADREAGL